MSMIVGLVCALSARGVELLDRSLRERALAASRRTAQACVALVALATLAGCGGGSQPAPNSDEGQIRAAMTVLGMEYGGFMEKHGGAPPKDEAEMRKYLDSRLTELSEYNIKGVDMLLRNG